MLLHGDTLDIGHWSSKSRRAPSRGVATRAFAGVWTPHAASRKSSVFGSSRRSRHKTESRCRPRFNARATSFIGCTFAPTTATQNTSITRIKTQPRHTGMGESKVRVHNALRTTSGVSVQAETLLRVRISRSDESRAAVEDFPVLDKLGLEQIAVARRAFRTARTGAKVPTSHDSIDGPALRFIKSQAYLLQCAHSLPNRSSRL